MKLLLININLINYKMINYMILNLLIKLKIKLNNYMITFQMLKIIK